MIANKLMRALYIVDLEGEAANLEFMLGKNFGVERVTLGSLDFTNDLEATRAAQDLVDFFADNPKLDVESATQELRFNPEFFPSQPPLKATEEQQMLEDAAYEHAEANIQPGQIPVIITRRFDPIGDYVTTSLSSEGSNFKIKMRIAINPEIYLMEKGKSLEMEQAVVNGPHREIVEKVILH